MEKMTCRQGMADTSQAWIYYKESGHGTPILMLHGNAETHLIFNYYEEKLVHEIPCHSHGQPRPRALTDQAGIRGIRVHYHRYGEGRSSASGYPSYPVLYLFGFSDGANIALEFASLFPERTQAVIAISGNVSPVGLILPVRAFCVGKYFCLKAATSLFRGICKKILPLPASFHVFSVINSSLPCSAILP